jgi:hypothetical protein
MGEEGRGGGHLASEERPVDPTRGMRPSGAFLGEGKFCNRCFLDLLEIVGRVFPAGAGMIHRFSAAIPTSSGVPRACVLPAGAGIFRLLGISFLED